MGRWLTEPLWNTDGWWMNSGRMCLVMTHTDWLLIDTFGSGRCCCALYRCCMRCTLACGDIPSLHPSCSMKQHKPETPTIAPNPPLSLKLSSAATERPPHMIILKNTGGCASPVATARLLDSLNRSGGRSGSVEPNHEGSNEEKDKAEQHSLKEGNAHFNQRANHLVRSSFSDWQLRGELCRFVKKCEWPLGRGADHERYDHPQYCSCDRRAEHPLTYRAERATHRIWVAPEVPQSANLE